MARGDDETQETDELGSAASLLRDLAAAPGAPIGAGGPLHEGQRVADKYRVERAIGEGGMGVVYLARDTRLDRDAALKVGSAGSAAGLARIEREAQALARLSHPNVVTVYEVGEVDGRVFVAMEYVAGGTARSWLSARSRTPREIIALFAAAGDGLAAAHAAGIVHRDFKPDNLLVGDDGRPRVADFGLARGLIDHEPAPADDLARTPSSPLPTMTRTGAVMGTPAYMPPEQLAGEAVDARADQFAFCAALWEALHGTRPFTGATPAAVQTAIESSEPRTAGGARARQVPRHVEVALRRGLRADPAERWPSMAPLLVELRRDPARRRRNAALAAGVIVALAAAIVVPRLLATAPDPCTGGPAQIATAWGPARADRVRAAFAAVRRDWATQGGARAIATLDERARQWAISYRAVCEAGAGAWSAALHDRGVQCLARARNQIAAVADVLAGAGARDAARADGVLAGLPVPESCADPSYVARVVPPPADPARARAADAIDRVLARSRALYDAGRPGLAFALLPPMVASATALGNDSLRAEANSEAGMILTARSDYDRAIPLLRESYFTARDATDDVTAAYAARDMANALIGARRLPEADDWARLGLADTRRIQFVPGIAASLEQLAMIALAREDLARARDYADRAVDLARSARSEVVLAEALADRAPIDGERGDHRAEVDDARAALDLMTRHAGQQHPVTLRVRSELGYALGIIGERDEAIALERETIAIAEQNPSPDTLPALADATASLGASLLDAGRDAEALPPLERAIALLTQVEGASADVASAMNNRGNALLHVGRVDEAIAALRGALAIAVIPATADPFLEASVRASLADALLGHGDAAAAETEARASIAGWQKLGGQPFRESHSVDVLGRVLDRAHRTADAVVAFHRALALLDGTDATATDRGTVELHLAHALAAADPAAARTVAAAARDHLRDGPTDLVADADRLLRDLGVR